MVKAVVDLGTNSIKCVIAKLDENGEKILLELNETTRLGKNIADSRIGRAAMERSLRFLRQVSERCVKLDAEEVSVVGAQIFRVARDAGVFRRKVREEFGWEVRALSPGEEARLVFEASSLMAPEGIPILVFDTGGGSTEFSFGEGHRLRSSHSLPLGAVDLTSRFIGSDPVELPEIEALASHVRQKLSLSLPAGLSPFTIGCGGCLASLASVALKLERYDALKVHGFSLEKEEIERQARLYRGLDQRGRKNIPGLPADRADIILAGSVVVLEIAKHFKLGTIKVSTRGLRHALLSGRA